MRLLITLILFFVILTEAPIANVSAHHIIRINEVLYDPKGNDNNKEFIEIMFQTHSTNTTDSDQKSQYFTNSTPGNIPHNIQNNNQTFPFISLEDYIISDGDANDTLRLCKNVSSPYALIVEDGFDLLPNCTIYCVGATIGNGLSYEDTITLYNTSGFKVDSFHIHQSASGNSLELYNGSFFLSKVKGGTPGKVNSVSRITQKNQTFTNQTNQNNRLNTSINTTSNSTSFLTNQTANQTLNKTLNISFNDSLRNQTNFFMNFTSENIPSKNLTFSSSSLCTTLPEIQTNKRVYESGEKIEMHFNVNESLPFFLTYWIESLEGTTVKKPYTTRNTNTKSWTTKTVLSHEAFLIHVNMTFEQCNTTTNSTYLFAVTSNTFTKDATTSIYLSTSKQEYNADDVISTKITVNKGDTKKKAVKVWIAGKEKESDVISLSYNTKFTASELMLPLTIKEPCSLQNNTYSVIAEGLGLKVILPVVIQNISCFEPQKTVMMDTNSYTQPRNDSLIHPLVCNRSNHTSVYHAPLITNVPCSKNNTLCSSILTYESSQEIMSRRVPLILLVISIVLHIIFYKQKIYQRA